MNFGSNSIPLKPSLQDFKIGSVTVEIEVTWIQNCEL
jgi:hypothetical protein